MASNEIHCPKCMKDSMQPTKMVGSVQFYKCPSCEKQVGFAVDIAQAKRPQPTTTGISTSQPTLLAEPS